MTQHRELTNKDKTARIAPDQKLLMVLGMHRSGTSAITRGLEVLGVSLGENLLPPQDDNPKGFFEDKDLVSLNERILSQVGHKWHGLSPISTARLTAPGLVTERMEAAALLERKFQGASAIGLKDPRLSLLLPFWDGVLADTNTETGFIIPVRNPLEVAQSLMKRDGISLERATALWGRYMCDALRATDGKTRLFVDFEKVLEDPVAQLSRIAEAFGLEMPSAKSAELENYKDEFLDAGLRKNKTNVRELVRSGHTTDIVIDLYRHLSEFAALPASDERTASNHPFESVLERFEGIAPLTRAMDALEDLVISTSTHTNSQTEALRNTEKRLHEVQTAHDDACAQRDEASEQARILQVQLESLRDLKQAEQLQLHERLATVQQAHDVACQQRDDANKQVEQLLRVRQEIQDAHDRVAEQLDRTKQDMHELAKAHAAVMAERDAQRGRANSLQAIARHEAGTAEHLRAALARAEADIDQYRTSTSWKLTAPLRAAIRLARREPARSQAQPAPPAPAKGLSSRLLKLFSAKELPSRRLLPPALPAQLRASAGVAPSEQAPWLAVIVHAFYPELLPEIIEGLKPTHVPIKLYVTTPSESVAEVHAILQDQRFPYALIETENRGRDVAPFLSAMRWVNEDRPDFVLKLHTKKSTHLDKGEHWRSHLYESLIGLDGPKRALEIFEGSPDVGLLGPDGHILSASDYAGRNGASISHLLQRFGIDQADYARSGFVAGTMFYARHEVLKDLTDQTIPTSEFELEQGQTDGTLAHALERILGALTHQRGYRVASLGNSSQQTIPLQKGAYPYL